LFFFWDSYLFPETNGSKFGGEVQAEDKSVQEELAATATTLVDMPVDRACTKPCMKTPIFISF
jgi:hypothetical protein